MHIKCDILKKIIKIKMPYKRKCIKIGVSNAQTG